MYIMESSFLKNSFLKKREKEMREKRNKEMTGRHSLNNPIRKVGAVAEHTNRADEYHQPVDGGLHIN